jgi:dynein heavy chain
MIQLEHYDKQYENDAKNSANNRQPNPDMIQHFEKIFNQWIEKINQYLEETEAERKDDKEAGPRAELEYWRQRMRKLTCISEQLRSKNCRTVYDVLT